MKKLKKFAALLLVGVMALALLTACGGGGGSSAGLDVLLLGLPGVTEVNMRVDEPRRHAKTGGIYADAVLSRSDVRGDFCNRFVFN